MTYEASQETESRDAESSDESTNDDLLGELARAMHHAASSQYGRMNAELERRRTEQVEAIAARAAAEADRLKASSDADISAIDAWAKAETEKIKLERLRRIDAHREELEAQLERQETIKEREVLAIEVAIDAHRNEIDAFFGRMERETDPAAIAQVASTLPSFPPLAEIAENAGRGAAAELAALQAAEPAEAPEAPPIGTTAEKPAPDDSTATSVATDLDATASRPALMPVMDPEAARGSAEESRPWEAPYAVSIAAGSIVREAAAAEATAVPETPHRVGSTLLRTVRAIRPMGGERHERKDEQR